MPKTYKNILGKILFEMSCRWSRSGYYFSCWKRHDHLTTQT